jgi:hypothetical protein
MLFLFSNVSRPDAIQIFDCKLLSKRWRIGFKRQLSSCSGRAASGGTATPVLRFSNPPACRVAEEQKRSAGIEHGVVLLAHAGRELQGEPLVSVDN